MGGGGSGGYNSGGGGGSGTILYVKNFILDRLPELEITYNIASSSSGNGNPTEVIIKGETITVPGGMSGGNHGFNGSNGGYGGNGGDLNESSIISILSKYVSDKSTDIAISSNGGGSGGYWNSSQSKYGYGGGSGSTMSQSGISGSGSTGGDRATNSDGTGGNRSVIESLKSKFRRCIAMPYGDDAAMVSYCKESYSAEWPDGTMIEIKSNHQNRMVHFPKYYHKTIKRFSNIWRTYISEQQLDNDYVEEPEALLASFEGAINSEGMLISTAHQPSASSKTINEFVTAAKTHGPLWGIGDYRTHATIARMFCAYYKNTNISTNNSNIPCSGGTKRYNYGLTGSTIHLGNIDGKRETLEDVGYYSTNFLGLEDCYYSKWEFVQGINILKGKYVVYDGGSFPDKDVAELEAAGATNIRVVGYEPNPAATEGYNGWTKAIAQGKYGDVLPTAHGGSETTYYSDYGWFNPTANRIFLRSGHSGHGSQCGVFMAGANDASSDSWPSVGARLAFYGKIVVVDSDTFKKNQV